MNCLLASYSQPMDVLASLDWKSYLEQRSLAVKNSHNKYT